MNSKLYGRFLLFSFILLTGLNSMAGTTTIFGYGYGVPPEKLHNYFAPTIAAAKIPISDPAEITIVNPWGRIDVSTATSDQIEVILKSNTNLDYGVLNANTSLENIQILVDQDTDKIKISVLVPKLTGPQAASLPKNTLSFLYKLLIQPTEIGVKIPNYILTKLNILGEQTVVNVSRFKKYSPETATELNIKTHLFAASENNSFDKINIEAFENIHCYNSKGIINLKSDILKGEINVIDHIGSGSITANNIILNSCKTDTVSGKYLITYPPCLGRFANEGNAADMIVVTEIPDTAFPRLQYRCN